MTTHGLDIKQQLRVLINNWDVDHMFNYLSQSKLIPNKDEITRCSCYIIFKKNIKISTSVS